MFGVSVRLFVDLLPERDGSQVGEGEMGGEEKTVTRQGKVVR